MSLDAALGIANGGLSVISQGFGVISNNVANANTTGYATEQTTQTDLDAGGLGIGVGGGPTQLAQDAALAAQVAAQSATAGGAAVTDSALSALQPALGTVGAGNDLGSLLGNVQTSFSALLNDPGNQSQQGAVVDAAGQLTGQINAMAGAYGQARQAAQDALVTDVGTLNTALAKIGALSNQIILLQSEGKSTADLENQRNLQTSTIASLVAARFVTQPNGDMQIFTDGGVQLPTRGDAPLSIAAAQTSPTLYYPGGGLPGIMLNGIDCTSALGGGAIGAQLTLRDTTLPAYTGELDEFSQNLASRFDAQGLTLFTDPQGNVPAAGGTPAQANYLGFSSSITVNPAVVATPSLVRDGTQAVAGSPTGASAFTPNPNNDAGFSTMIQRMLDYALGTQVQPGVPQTPGLTSGLGASISATGFGALTQIVTDAGRTKQTIDQLTAETASGYISSSFAGLGSGAPVALDLSPQLAVNAQIQANTQSAGTIQSAQTALGQIESIASSFASQATQLIGLQGTTQSLAANAQDALTQVANLLDTKVGDVYVFAGQDSANPPVPDPANINSSAFAQAIQTAVAGLSTNGQAAVSAATLAIASPGGTSPFSAGLDAGPPQAQVDLGGGNDVALAPLANANCNAASPGVGTTSTGSYTRDILRGLATLGSLTDAQSSDPNFTPLVQDTITSLQGAVSAINTDIGALGDRQNQVTAAQTEAASTATALKTQLSSVQEADLTQVATQLSQAQTQLQASYQLISN